MEIAASDSPLDSATLPNTAPNRAIGSVFSISQGWCKQRERKEAQRFITDFLTLKALGIRLDDRFRDRNPFKNSETEGLDLKICGLRN
ncbi:MAG: hypothetical protein OHK0037_31890 [Elainellaceae cyanobacterium]